MSFAQDNGYTPQTFEQLMEAIRLGINSQFGTSYTTESFVGTGWYKYFYSLVQKIQENENKTSEVFLKLQQYIPTTNDRIQRPSVSNPGIIDSFADNDWVASVKQNEIGDAGTVSICVDVDETADTYAAEKLEINTFIKDFISAGIISTGTETSTITLSNGQSFDFKFHLPNRIPVLLKITFTVSENNLLFIPDDETIRQAVFDNINTKYRLGWNFEPQRYYTLADALWASSVLLEWSDDAGANWYSTIYDANFDDLFTFDLEDIQVVIA